MKRLVAILNVADKATDPCCFFAGVACLTVGGFHLSPAAGWLTLGVCLVSMPLLFSWVLPALVKRQPRDD